MEIRPKTEPFKRKLNPISRAAAPADFPEEHHTEAVRGTEKQDTHGGKQNARHLGQIHFQIYELISIWLSWFIPLYAYKVSTGEIKMGKGL